MLTNNSIFTLRDPPAGLTQSGFGHAGAHELTSLLATATFLFDQLHEDRHTSSAMPA